MESDKIVLVGLPGCGKSTLGRELSARLALPYFDLDRVIKEREGSTVPEIFATKGELYFRKLEATCLSELLEEKGGMVLATGGGAPCFHDNMQLILKTSLSIYLEVSFDELADRLLAAGVERRPLLAGIKSKGELVLLLEEKFAARIPTYQKADLHFPNNSGSSVTELIEKIQARRKFKR